MFSEVSSKTDLLSNFYYLVGKQKSCYNGSMKHQSWRAIFLITAAIVLILLLGMGIGGINLSEGYTIPLEDVGELSDVSLTSDVGSDALVIVIRGFLALALVLLPVYVVYSLFSPEGRKRLVADVIVILFLLGLAQIIENYQREEAPPVEMEGGTEIGGNPLDFNVAQMNGKPLPELPDEAPEWISAVVIALLGIVIAGAVGTGIWFYNKYKKTADSSLDQLAEEAQNAIDSIQSGADLQTAILRSYAEMNSAIKKELGLARDRAMTARDFEDYLTAKGLPSAPLRTLTRLFEQARYGRFTPGNDDEAAAIGCLTEIIGAVQQLKAEK